MNPLAQLSRAPSTSPARAEFLLDALEGLQAASKRLSPKYFYDERGSSLFEEITRLPEYYLTRVELQIMREFAPEMAQVLEPGCRLVEFGSGSSLKSRVLLSALESPAAYIPVDISAQQLRHSALELGREFPRLAVQPVAADFTQEFELPNLPYPSRRTVVYFPGSTIGNFEPAEVRPLLARIARLVGPEGGLLVGFDLRKDVSVLEAAYNDSRGVTRAFNLNVLVRLQRELEARLNLEDFEHLAYYNRSEGRIEMHLVSMEDQSIDLGGQVIPIGAGETIHTENSYKYEPDGLLPLALATGLVRQQTWVDAGGNFSVQYYGRLDR